MCANTDEIIIMEETKKKRETQIINGEKFFMKLSCVLSRERGCIKEGSCGGIV